MRKTTNAGRKTCEIGARQGANHSQVAPVGSFTLYSNLVLTLAAVFFLVRNRWAGRIDLTPDGKILAVALTHELNRGDTYRGFSKVLLVDFDVSQSYGHAAGPGGVILCVPEPGKPKGVGGAFQVLYSKRFRDQLKHIHVKRHACQDGPG